MNSDFERVNWEPVYDADDVNVALNYFNEIVKAIFDRHAPFMVKRLRGKPCPWMHHDLRSAMVDRDRLLTKARKTKKVEDWIAYKCLRNKCNNKLKSAKSTFERNLLENNTTNPKKFWRVIKKVFPFRNSPKNSSHGDNEENQARFMQLLYDP